MLTLPPCERNGFYGPAPNHCDRELNFVFGLFSLAKLTYLADHLRMSCLRAGEHLDRAAEVEKEMMTLGAYIQMVCQEVFNRLTIEDTTHIRGNDDILIRVFQ